jgi:BirA family biotin operon repressor/biotin-[acetyl-CoA-carboxylase] ligase
LVGVGAARAISECAGVECQLKWPNDLLAGGRKVAGILLHSRLSSSGIDYLNLGIGINVSSNELELPVDATSLALEGWTNPDQDLLLSALCRQLDEIYDAFCRGEIRPLLDEWRSRAAFLGEEVSIVRENETLIGRFRGVDDSGHLLLERDSGEVLRLAQGDVVRGPRREQFVPGFDSTS